VSLVDESRGLLLVGDCLGVVGGELVRAPARFTSDAAGAEQSLRRLRDLRGSRMLFAHGPEISRPWEALDALLVEG
jgi:glyoxylase-like metal-dependent hydrolase (beta-lactamase superfamily II)